MKREILLYPIALLAACLAASGCSNEKETTDEVRGGPTVYAVNYPLAYFAERIAGDQAEVVFPDVAGDPAFWQPDVAQLVAFQNADLILLNGASYAKWVGHASLPQSRILDTSVGFSDRYIVEESAVTHSHGPGGDHAHGSTAFTTWLDLSLAVQQAAAIDSELDVPDSGFEELRADLLRLDAEWAAAFGELSGLPLLGSHPVYQYLARRYQLDLKSVHWEPDVEPDDAMWQELESVLSEHPARVMLWEGEPLPAAKARLSEAGIASIVFDPCGSRPETGDFLSAMEQNLSNLRAFSASD